MSSLSVAKATGGKQPAYRVGSDSDDVDSSSTRAASDPRGGVLPPIDEELREIVADYSSMGIPESEVYALFLNLK